MNPFSTITLLIVDDEAEIRSGLRTIIPWNEYSISVIGTAVNGAEALDQIRYYEPDIVITDIQMPGMNGLELVRRATEEQFDCSFVILSGYDDFEYARTAIKYGIRDYLLKPISIKELTELIIRLKEEILDRRNLHTDQLSTLKKLRTAQISLRKHNLVPQLLRGELSVPQLHSVLEEYSLPVKDRESCVVLIQVFNSRQDTEEHIELNQSLVLLKELLNDELNGCPVLIAEHPPAGLLLIVNLPFIVPGRESLTHLLSDYLNDQIFFDTVHAAAAIGEPVPSLTDIAASYQSARQMITWHIYPDAGPVIDISMTENLQPPVIMPGNEILDAVLRDDPEDIRLQFCKYLDKLVTVPPPPPSYIYSMCNYLIITIQNELAKFLEGLPKSYVGNSYVTLHNLASLDEIRDWMCEILCGFANELLVNRATKSDPLIEKAIAYINENLLKNPHTEDVSNYLGLSKSYFSTYFKNKTQLNFRDYTLDLKINYAQEQLKHPERTPGEVSIMLGYEDYRSFSRAFKTRTGLTPSDYQKQYTGVERS